jgi:hypothetical protein
MIGGVALGSSVVIADPVSAFSALIASSMAEAAVKSTALAAWGPMTRRRKSADASMWSASITVPASCWAGASVISAVPYARAVEVVDVALAAIGDAAG